MQWYIFMSIFYVKLSDSQSTFNFREVKENRRDQDDKHMQIFQGFLLKIVMLQPITAPVKVICRVSHFIFFLQESWAFLWKGKAHQLDSKYLFKYNYTKNIFVVKKNNRLLSCFLFFLRHILFSSITLHLHRDLQLNAHKITDHLCPFMNKNLQQKELYEQTSQMFKEYYVTGLTRFQIMKSGLDQWKFSGEFCSNL